MDDDQDQKPKKKLLSPPKGKKPGGLIPPPPPMSPGVQLASLLSPQAVAISQLPSMAAPGGFMQGPAQAQMQPQGMPQQAPQGMPQQQQPQMPSMLNTAQLMRTMAPDPAMVQGLQNTLGSQQTLANQAQDRLKDISKDFLPVPTQHQTKFESFLQDNLQKQIMQAFTQKQSKGDKFSRGYDMGQRIASDLVIPLFGLHSHKLGAAAGANEAAQAIKGNLANSEQGRRQTEAARNNLMLNLAQAYESMDPNSSKNLSALLGKQIEAQNANRQKANDARKDAGDTLENVAKTQEKLAGLNSPKDMVNALLQQEGHGIQAAGLGLRKDEFAQKQSNDAQNQTRANSELAVQQQNAKTAEGNLNVAKNSLGLRQKELQQKIDNTSNEDKRKDFTQQLASTKELERFVRLNAIDAMAPMAGGNGGAKYAGYADFLEKNPVQKRIFQKLADGAGMKGLDPDSVFKALRAQNEVEANGGKPWYSPAVDLLTGGLNGLSGQSSASDSPAPKAIPSKKLSPIEILKQRGFRQAGD